MSGSVFRRKTIWSILFLVMLCSMGLVLICYQTLYAPILLSAASSRSIKVYPGDSLSRFAHRLQQQGYLDHPFVFVLAARLKRLDVRLQVGEYQLTDGMNVLQLLENSVHGQHQVKHTMTLIEGWTLQQVRSVIQGNSNLTNTSSVSLQHALSDLQRPYASAEGLLMPDTYQFHWGSPASQLLAVSHQSMMSFLTEQWQHRAADLPYKTMYQALIAASLIEKETALPHERAMVSAVICQRLKKGMRLQIDATVRYAVQKQQAVPLSMADLQSPSPYNTYRTIGLPPTPIDMPSRASIHAALHPAKTDALYYVLAPNGHHVFSAHYAAHQQAVQRYRYWHRQNTAKES